METKKYIGTYKVLKVFKKSHRRQIIRTGLTEKEAQRLAQSYPDSNISMVIYTKQFNADKYFI